MVSDSGVCRQGVVIGPPEGCAGTLSRRIAASVGSSLASGLGISTRQRDFLDAAGGAWTSLMVDVDVDDVVGNQELAETLRRALAATDLRFRFGLAGIEVDEARTWPELVDDVESGTLFAGVVLHLDAWKALGGPLGFSPYGQHMVSVGSRPNDGSRED